MWFVACLLLPEILFGTVIFSILYGTYRLVRPFGYHLLHNARKQISTCLNKGLSFPISAQANQDLFEQMATKASHCPQLSLDLLTTASFPRAVPFSSTGGKATLVQALNLSFPSRQI